MSIRHRDADDGACGDSKLWQNPLLSSNLVQCMSITGLAAECVSCDTVSSRVQNTMEAKLWECPRVP